MDHCMWANYTVFAYIHIIFNHSIRFDNNAICQTRMR